MTDDEDMASSVGAFREVGRPARSMACLWMSRGTLAVVRFKREFFGVRFEELLEKSEYPSLAGCMLVQGN